MDADMKKYRITSYDRGKHGDPRPRRNVELVSGVSGADALARWFYRHPGGDCLVETIATCRAVGGIYRPIMLNPGACIS
jgi:hypothetical protein